jgi:hypothetical protein
VFATILSLPVEYSKQFTFSKVESVGEKVIDLVFSFVLFELTIASYNSKLAVLFAVIVAPALLLWLLVFILLF